MSTQTTKNRLRVHALCEGAILLALAIVLNYLSKVVFANMPNGGSVTLAMFPILFYAHRWGVGRSLLMGFAYGLLDMLLDGGYAWGWQSILLDYLVAYTALGLGGVFQGKSWGIFPGIVLGCLARFLVHHISGITLYRILEPTEISGFGVFETKAREARVGRNPVTRQAVEIPATRVPSFKPSKALKEIVEK